MSYLRVNSTLVKAKQIANIGNDRIYISNTFLDFEFSVNRVLIDSNTLKVQFHICMVYNNIITSSFQYII